MNQQDEEVMLRLRNVYAYYIHQMDESAKKYGLTGIQWMIINDVGLNENITMHDLATKLNLSKANLSAIIKRMQTNNIIYKERSTLDQRYVYIHLTEKGIKLFNHIKEDMQMQYPTWQQLDEEEKDKVLSSLEVLEDFVYQDREKQKSR